MPPKSKPSSVPVVLVAPAVLGPAPDYQQIAAHLALAGARALISLSEPAPDGLLAALEAQAVARQWLLAPGLPPPELAACHISMPPGSLAGEQDALALALSDTLVATPDAVSPLLEMARRLRRKPHALEAQLHLNLKTADGFGVELDPEGPGWAWLPKPWRAVSYKIDRKQDASPDTAARVAEAPIVEAYRRLDRAAIHGAKLHRALTWVAFLLTAFSVLAAVAGALYGKPGEEHWSVAELLALALILATMTGVRVTRLQERWTACRMAAEQLRIARMCIPLRVTPSGFHSIDHVGIELPRRAMTAAKRALRDQGLPRITERDELSAAQTWLRDIIHDQLADHRSNHPRLERTEERLLWVNYGLFIAAAVAVLCHLVGIAPHWILLVTAAGPALAAAVHGAAVRTGIVHRAALSQEAEQELTPLAEELAQTMAQTMRPEQAWPALRALALRAADTMGRENTSWHGVVRRHRDTLPT
jgi:hypothetical protein